MITTKTLYPTTVRPVLPPWLAAFGLTARDLRPFAGELRVEDDALLARYRGRSGREVGWEVISRTSAGPVSRFTGAARGATFRTRPLPRPRLVLSRGALQAIALSAHEGHRDDTAYVGIGDGCGPAARAALSDYLQRYGVQQIVEAFGACDADLTVWAAANTHTVGLAERLGLGPLWWDERKPPGGCWLRALGLARHPSTASDMGHGPTPRGHSHEGGPRPGRYR